MILIFFHNHFLYPHTETPTTVDTIVLDISKQEEEKTRHNADVFVKTASISSQPDMTVAPITSYSSALISMDPTSSSTISSKSIELPAAQNSSMTIFGIDNIPRRTQASDAILKQRRLRNKEPEWHAPWKLKRVIAAHQGWIYNSAVDPSNEWFATCSVDRTIKIWDLASGILKVTLMGHVAPVRDIAISDRHPYIFSASEDREAKCWDLETNRIVRNYHGHLSGVYSIEVHPTLDLVVTGGRDSSCRVWDMRMKTCVRTLVGHRHTVSSIGVQGFDPQIITGSYDATVKLWDLRADKALTTLTNHKKSVRNLVIHHTENTFASASADNLKMWKLPEGTFMRNASHEPQIINGLALNKENVLVSGSNNGTLEFYDWSTGYKFQELRTPPQPGSIEPENGIFGLNFDMTGTRLISTEADKTIKIYQPDPDANPTTHPINFQPRKRAKY